MAKGFWENLMGAQAQAAEPAQDWRSAPAGQQPNYTGSGPAYKAATAPTGVDHSKQREEVNQYFALDPRSPWERLMDFFGMSQGSSKSPSQAQQRNGKP